MATTRLMPLHTGKGRSISEALGRTTDYIKNPDKTDGGEWVSAYECDPMIVEEEFLYSKREYTMITGRNQGDRNVIAYHMRQSFKPGEIDPATANKIAYDLTMSLTKGKHAFIVCPHVDKSHIHSHIVFNSTSLDYSRKFRNFWGSSFAIRKISDRLCLENGLSIIENPKPSRGHYGEWLDGNKPLSWQEKLCIAIDNSLAECKSFDNFLTDMKSAGYEIKQGKYLAFRAPEQQRFTRCNKLGEDYTEDAIRERIDGKRIVTPRHESVKPPEPKKLNLLIDVQNCIKAKGSPGYEQWIKVFNLKQAAQTLIFLQENNLTEYEILEEKTAQATKKFNDLSVKIKQKEKRMNDISSLQKYISNYSRTKDIYVQYRQSGYNKKFLAEHEGDIILHQAAKKAFDELGLKKLPTIKTLQQEYATVLAEKKIMYQSYRQAKDDMMKFATAKSNTDRLLQYSKSEQTKKIERSER